MTDHHRTTRQLPRFEPLEKRQLMTGDVQIFHTGQELRINGDQQDNQIMIEELDAGVMSIAGIGKTSVNGKASQTYAAEGLRSITINLQGGDDKLVMKNLDMSNSQLTLKIVTGSGNDTLLLERVAIGGNLYISQGSGNDETALLNVDVKKDVIVSSQRGNDLIWIEKANIGDDLGIYPSIGNDTVVVGNVNVTDSASIVASSGDDTVLSMNATFGDLFVYGHHGRDRVLLEDIVVNDFLRLDLGSGFDQVHLDSITSKSARISNSVGDTLLNPADNNSAAVLKAVDVVFEDNAHSNNGPTAANAMQRFMESDNDFKPRKNSDSSQWQPKFDTGIEDSRNGRVASPLDTLMAGLESRANNRGDRTSWAMDDGLLDHGAATEFAVESVLLATYPILGVAYHYANKVNDTIKEPSVANVADLAIDVAGLVVGGTATSEGVGVAIDAAGALYSLGKAGVDVGTDLTSENKKNEDQENKDSSSTPPEKEEKEDATPNPTEQQPADTQPVPEGVSATEGTKMSSDQIQVWTQEVKAGLTNPRNQKTLPNLEQLASSGFKTNPKAGWAINPGSQGNVVTVGSANAKPDAGHSITDPPKPTK